jgi:hypothetical protein
MVSIVTGPGGALNEMAMSAPERRVVSIRVSPKKNRLRARHAECALGGVVASADI